MKTIRFNFNHPVNGNAVLTPITCTGSACQRLKVTSLNDNSLEIPVDDCGKGKWKLTLDWEHDGRMFSHQEEFEISNLDQHSPTV
ncbi:hypothetical protein DYU05_06945 [Mucilaginibacter terrenus]|uniref:Uncharacterized protein n=1 Tax=Mucilaginibacter terrenus TaxID=2482727 RepID=A0A3E2NWI9_9SPHI|nr:hypothetical protein [Mucilaginibacter terrenus]RFZ85327.1 hypothetical protein DYU05_06945 [Mucilaginibacter terrenus]